jgi:hypothetical protein
MILAAFIGWLLSGSFQTTSDSCSFSVVSQWSGPNIHAPDSISSRVEVLHQADSPVRLTSVDLQDYNLVSTATSFEASGRLRATLKNVSDRTVDGVTVEVRAGTANDSVGSSGTLRTRLEPNEMASLVIVAGQIWRARAGTPR